MLTKRRNGAMANSEPQSGFESIIKRRATRSIWSCLRHLSNYGSNREGAAIVDSFQLQMDIEFEAEGQALAS